MPTLLEGKKANMGQQNKEAKMIIITKVMILK
jgi:hypothetical protein